MAMMLLWPIPAIKVFMVWLSFCLDSKMASTIAGNIAIGLGN